MSKSDVRVVPNEKMQIMMPDGELWSYNQGLLMGEDTRIGAGWHRAAHNKNPHVYGAGATIVVLDPDHGIGDKLDRNI